MYNVLIVEDVSIMVWGLKAIIKETLGGAEVQVDYATNREELFEYISSKNYDIIIVDLNIQKERGLELLQNIIEQQEHPNVIASSKFDREYLFEACLKLPEVKAFFCKKSSEEDIQQAILLALKGEKYIPQIQQQILDKVYVIDKETVNPFDLLSYQEQKVAQLLLRGFGILEIGNELEITSSTASTYKSRIFKKMNIHNIIELNKYAHQFKFPLETFASN